MNCYVCDMSSTEVQAVAICQHCGVGLCKSHLHEDLVGPRANGMSRRGCTHQALHHATSADAGATVARTVEALASS
jgi:hypothetical protein